MPNRYTHLHEQPQGAGDGRPTALDITNNEDLSQKLAGKVILVTGISSGLGLETVKALVNTGATIYGTVRDVAKAQTALGPLVPTGKVQLIHMELDDLASVKAGTRDFLQKTRGKLNVLIENAGVMMCPYSKTRDGFEMQFGTNHVGHFLLFHLLKDALLASVKPDFNSRVVIVTSGGNKYVDNVRFDDYNFEREGSYDPNLGYGQSKLANIWMANHIERLYGRHGLHAIPVHPGTAMTDIERHLPQEFIDQMLALPEVKNYIKSPEQAAASIVMCAVGRQFEGAGGRLAEDCDWSVPETESRYETGPLPKLGYAPQTYDRKKEERLWGDSSRMVGKFL